MATFKELDDLLIAATQGSFDGETRPFINRAVRAIAGGILMPDEPRRLSPPLPDLYTSDVVPTSTENPHAPLPDAFGRELFFATAGGIAVKVFDTFSEFLRYYPTLSLTSTVVAVSHKGKKLYYQGKPPSNVDITIHFYRRPVDMEDDSDEPDGIPEHLQESLIVGWAAKEIFNLVEDGIGDQKTNTVVYTDIFSKGMLDLEAVIGRDQEPVMLEAVEW